MFFENPTNKISYHRSFYSLDNSNRVQSVLCAEWAIDSFELEVEILWAPSAELRPSPLESVESANKDIFYPWLRDQPRRLPSQSSNKRKRARFAPPNQI